LKNANLKIFELLSPKYERDNIKLGLSRIKKALQELGILVSISPRYKLSEPMEKDQSQHI